jgi:hypothetical protein
MLRLSVLALLDFLLEEQFGSFIDLRSFSA